MNIRPTVIPTTFLLAPLVISAASTGVLIAFPGNTVVWQIGAWSLASCLLVLIVALPVTAYSLATNASARTWPKAMALALGILYLAVLVAGAISPGI